MINAAATVTSDLPVFERQLSVSGNGTARDAGMLAYIGINGAGLPSSPSIVAPGSVIAKDDIYNSLTPCSAAPCPAFTVADPGKGLIANDTNVYGVHVMTAPTGGTLTLNTNGTLTYVSHSETSSYSFN